MSISSTHKRARRGMRFRFCGCGGAQQEEHEALCVPVADAVPDPRAVVVHAQHAHAALLKQKGFEVVNCIAEQGCVPTLQW